MINIDELQLISGIEIPVEELGLTFHQPRIKDIAILGEQNYFLALSIFKMNKEQLKIKAPEVTNWIIFTESLKESPNGVKNIRTLMSNFLHLFLPYNVILGPHSIIVNTPSGIINIEEENFEDFQSVVSLIGGSSLLGASEEEFKPGNSLAAEIAEKMKKARKRIAAQQPEKKSNGFIARYARAVAIATPNSLKDVTDMTLLQLNDLMQTYLGYESYDIEIRSRLAGAKGDGKIEHWMMREINTTESSIQTV